MLRRVPVVAVALLSVLPVRAQSQSAPNPEEEGRWQERAVYYQQRRLNPADPDFNAAAARWRAVELVKQREALSDAVSGLLWQNIGPAPTTDGQTPTSTPRIPSDVSGRVSAIAITTGGVVYVGGAQGGVWRSTDNGASWTPLLDDYGSTAIGSIAIDPDNELILYAGTGEGNGSCDSYSGIGVFKSTDGGDTWSGPFGSAEFTNRAVNWIAVDRNDSDHLLAASSSGIFGIGCTAAPSLPDRGLFESNDAGMTWTKRTANNRRFSVVLQDPLTATTWWGAGWTSSASVEPGAEGGLVKSTDNGMTWSQVAGSGGLPALSTAWGRGWVTATQNGAGTQSVIYAANSLTNGAIFRSLDSGATWSELFNASGYCGGQCFYDLPIMVEPGNADILYVGGAGQSTVGALPSQFMRSNNATSGTPTFTDLVRSADNSTAVHADMHAFATVPGQPAKLWQGNDGGVWRSDDRGTNLIDVNSNLALTQFSGCDLHPTLSRAYGGTQDNGTMGWTGSDAWPHLDFGDGGFARIDQGDPDNLVHTYFNQTGSLLGVGWTTNGFATTMGFYCFTNGNGINLGDRVLFYAPIHLDRGNTDTLYYGSHRLYRATDFFPGSDCAAPTPFSPLGGGAGQDLAPGGGALSAIETVRNGTSNALTLFTGSNNGLVFRSTNGGATAFSQVDLAGPATFVSDILVDPDNTQIVYQSRAGFTGSPGQNVRKSIDGGNTWAPSGTGLPDIPVNALEIDPVHDGVLWAGTDIGTFVSFDAGAFWQPASEGMADVAVFDLVSNGATGDLIACTHGRSAYHLSLDSLLFGDGFETGDTSSWSTTVN